MLPEYRSYRNRYNPILWIGRLLRVKLFKGNKEDR